MRKRIINSVEKQKIHSDQEWLDIEKIAIVKVTSEEEAFPIRYLYKLSIKQAIQRNIDIILFSQAISAASGSTLWPAGF